MLVVTVLVVVAAAFLFFVPVFPYRCPSGPPLCAHGTIEAYESPVLLLTSNYGNTRYGAVYFPHAIGGIGPTQGGGYDIDW